jgi:xanthine dehydrogenase accessory factor
VPLALALATREVVCVTTAGLGFVLATVQPDVLVDARMRKRETPERQRDLAPLTIGLGPGFVAGETTHLAVETQWGEALGTVVREGPTRALGGEPRSFDGHARDRFGYAPVAGVLRPGAAIGDDVPVTRGLKVSEVDPRGDVAAATGLGARPRRIAEGVLAAISG